MKHVKRIARSVIRSLGYELSRRGHADGAGGEGKAAPPPLILPTIPATAILSGETKVGLCEPVSYNGNVSLLELLLINTIVARKRARAVFEIGTFDGRTALNMIRNAAADAVLYTLDLPKANLGRTRYSVDPLDEAFIDKEVSGARFLNTPWAAKIVQLFGDSATLDFSPYSGRMDVIFIDGSHHFDYVKNDTERALNIAAKGATIIWHDYQPAWPGVIACLDGLYRSGGQFQSLRHIEDTSLVILKVDD